MMGCHITQKNLFSYQVDLDKRVRKNNPLRKIAACLDFRFVRREVKQFYGQNGNESVDPEIIMKMMFLLFWDNVKSERELMRIIPERLDYLWFLGYGLDDEVPDRSVLSKARKRWGRDVFEKLFINSVKQCLQAGLVGTDKIHVDGSVINANASRQSVLESSPELIAELKRVFCVQEHKLESHRKYKHYKRKNKSLISTTDPEAPVVRHSKQGSDGLTRPRYKSHRCVDDEYGVITAQKTTPGDVEENAELETLIEQHEKNTQQSVKTVVADKQYGTVENYRRLQQRGINTHMDCAYTRLNKSSTGIFPISDFKYEPDTDTYLCPAQQKLWPRRHDPVRKATEYTTRKGIYPQCPLKPQCTRSPKARTIARHDDQDLVSRGIKQAKSPRAYKDRCRRRYIIEGSFGQAATNHHFKQSRWRRLCNQQLQDDLIATVQNIKILIKYVNLPPVMSMSAIKVSLLSFFRQYSPKHVATWPYNKANNPDVGLIAL